MAAWSSLGSETGDRRRRTVRYLASVLSAATALLYFGIAIGLLKVVDQAPANAVTGGLFEFGVAAGSAFVLGAVLLMLFDHRGLWLLGALLQVGVLVMYLIVSAQRTPPFEVWGILIKVLQAGILVALGYLVLHAPAARLARTWRPTR